MKKYYVAYGSNMDERQMAARCPDSAFVGTGYVKGYELLFKGSQSGSYATIEPKAEGIVPVVIWSISRVDELRLDRYEGCPAFYYKKNIEVEMRERKINGLVYIMHEDRKFGIPFLSYYEQMEKDYHRFRFEQKILKGALDKSKEQMSGMRVQLLYMEDPQAPKRGTQGTIKYVDDIGTIHVAWDTGSSLGLIPGIDRWSIIE